MVTLHMALLIPYGMRECRCQRHTKRALLDAAITTLPLVFFEAFDAALILRCSLYVAH